MVVGRCKSRDTGRSKSRLADGFVGSQIDLLVFDAAPQPLDEDIVPPSPFAVHADGDAVAGEHAGEGRAGELRALVGVEDFRPAVRAKASSRVSTQKAASIVIDSATTEPDGSPSPAPRRDRRSHAPSECR